MTGFGVGGAPLGAGRLSLELRALNHRFFEARVRLPSELSEHTFFLEQLARDHFSRGRIEIGVHLEGVPSIPLLFSVERAQQVYHQLCLLRDRVAPGAVVPFEMLAAFPQLITDAAAPDTIQLHLALRSAFQIAVKALDQMRETEGAALQAELESRLQAARSCKKQIEERAGNLTQASRTRIRERLEKVLAESGFSVDRNRLETELILVTERNDISEELFRLDSHFDQLAQLIGLKGPTGRRMDFLLQEIGRESNTLGAKGQDAAIAHLVVDLKAEVERFREQVQNVE